MSASSDPVEPPNDEGPEVAHHAAGRPRPRLRPVLPAIRIRMAGRSTNEAHRVSSPLELLFDLTFVVAISQVSTQLAHGIATGNAGADLLPYLMVFFAIWWAWMNFTWFASAYDTDDVLYRVFTLVQMAGVLVLAAGVPSAFRSENFVAITIGYLIMRVGLVAQWVRAAIEDPGGRATAVRYAAAISVVQVGWITRLALPSGLGIGSFVVLAAADMGVPLWAERSGMSAWHPHHIAERYGLFTIIVLGESVAAATAGVQQALANSGVSVVLVTIASASLVLLFGLWWLYFLQPFGDELERRRNRSFPWGYVHYFVFASLAALGAGLEVAVEQGSGRAAISSVAVSYAIAIPLAVYLLMLAVLPELLSVRRFARSVGTIVAALIVLVLPLAAPLIGIAVETIGIAVVVAALVAFALAEKYRAGQREWAATQR